MGRAISTMRALQSGCVSAHNFHVLPKCHTLYLMTEGGECPKEEKSAVELINWRVLVLE